MSAMMIFLLIAAAVTVFTGLACWAYLSWDHYREQRRLHARMAARSRRQTAQHQWSNTANR
ncbi:MAG TPA: hypothetical protein VGN52_09500 [Burkholderiales bacterium]